MAIWETRVITGMEVDASTNDFLRISQQKVKFDASKSLLRTRKQVISNEKKMLLPSAYASLQLNHRSISAIRI